MSTKQQDTSAGIWKTIQKNAQSYQNLAPAQKASASFRFQVKAANTHTKTAAPKPIRKS